MADRRGRAPLAGRFQRPSTGEVLVVLRPPGLTYPIDVRVQWVTAEEDRAALNELLGGVLVMELDRLAAAVVDGEPFRLGPLREFGYRDGWTMTPQGTGAAARYQLLKDGSQRADERPRQDILLALELAIRCALLPFEDEPAPPAWVVRARAVYPPLLAALDGVDLFEPAPDASPVERLPRRIMAHRRPERHRRRGS